MFHLTGGTTGQPHTNTNQTQTFINMHIQFCLLQMLQNVIRMSFDSVQRFCLLSFIHHIYYKVFRSESGLFAWCTHAAAPQHLGWRKAKGGH